MSDSIVAETYQCPVCGEKDYILVTTVDQSITEIICLECGYDASNSADFIVL